MKILIVGGTGLISSYIAQELLDQNNDVTLYTRGQRPNRSGACVIVGDRTNHSSFEYNIRELGFFDVVIDMVVYTGDDALSAVRAFNGRVGQYIFCSSVEVYQKPASHYPITEAEAYGGRNDYSRSKIQAEEIFLNAAQNSGFPLTIIRPAYIYGEGEGPVNAFGRRTTYIDRMRKGKPIIVPGDGSSLWTACHSSDAAHAFTTAAGCEKAIGKIYHIAGNEWMTWDTYHCIVAETLGIPLPKLLHIPAEVLISMTGRFQRAYDTYQYNYIFDTTPACVDLDFHNTIPWSEGVRRMVSWLDEHHAVEPCEHDRYEEMIIFMWQGVRSILNIGSFWGKRSYKLQHRD